MTRRRFPAASVSALAAIAASYWFLRRDGAWDTYHQPVFLPFLMASVLMTVFSTTDLARDRADWRAFVVRAAPIGAVLELFAAGIASRNPIYDIHTRDIAALAALLAVLIVAAGFATELSERFSPGGWTRTAWCVSVSMGVMALVPMLLLLLH